ncbi:MAG: DMT family transporter [Candidatus Heimdallarchaeaceae archaeon]
MSGWLFGISIVCGLIYAALYNIGFVLEKKAILKLPLEKKEGFLNLLKSILTNKLWLLGAFLTIASMGFYYLALLWAPLSAIAPLTGFGLIVLIIYAHLDLKESLKKLELIGFALVIVGIVISSIMMSYGVKDLLWGEWKNVSHSINGAIVVFGSLLVAVTFTFIPVLFRKKIKPIDIAIFAGLMAGIQAIVFKGITVWSSEGNISLDLVIIVFYILTLLVISLMSTGSLQFAFKEGKVSNVMAIYNGVSTIFPMLFGGIILLEWNSLILVQQIFLGISLVMTVAGIILLSLKHSQPYSETNL